MIDLRSDTVTRPIPDMRQVMARADVGDDVFGEDPTVNSLQEVAAERLAELAGVVKVTPPETNIIVVRLATMEAAELARRLQTRGVLLSLIGPQQVRFVTHLDVTRADLEVAAKAFREALQA